MDGVFKGALASLAVLSAAAGTASALPRYDAEGYCQQVSHVSGGSSMIYKGCLDMEQTAYDKLKAGWKGLPVRARSYCDEVARVSGGSYQILDGCIGLELDAAGSTGGFNY